jgi:hypothetical protein
MGFWPGLELDRTELPAKIKTTSQNPNRQPKSKPPAKIKTAAGFPGPVVNTSQL